MVERPFFKFQVFLTGILLALSLSTPMRDCELFHCLQNDTQSTQRPIFLGSNSIHQNYLQFFAPFFVYKHKFVSSKIQLYFDERSFEFWTFKCEISGKSIDRPCAMKVDRLFFRSSIFFLEFILKSSHVPSKSSVKSIIDAAGSLYLQV